jgi:hypothetical protein
MAPDGAAMARRDFEGRTSKPDQFDAARVARTRQTKSEESH